MKAETYGVDAVPPAARTHTWFSLFAMFAGINICLPMMMVGGLLVPGLSLVQALAVGLIGNAVAASIVCLAGYPGADHGLPASVVTRISLGNPWGTRAASAATVLSLVGWFAVQAELAGVALSGAAMETLGIGHETAAIALMGALNIVFAVMGFRWMQRLAVYAVPALLVVSAILFAKIASRDSFWGLLIRPGDGSMSFLAGSNLMISGQIAGAFTSSDIARYAKDHRAIWQGVLLGVAPVSTFMIGLGGLSALASGEWNPVVGIREMGLGLTALLLLVFATWTTNDKNLYSGGLALTNLFPNRPRWQHTLALGAVGTLLGCFRLTQYFTQWLIGLGIVFAPLVGIIVFDYFFVRGRHVDLSSVYGRDDAYRYTGGLNVTAFVAIASGALVGRAAPPELLQPLVALVTTGIVYVAGSRWTRPRGKETHL